MDMELTHGHVTYPLWLRISFLGTLLFPFVALYFVRTRRDPIGMLLIPVAGSLVATWLGLLLLAEGMSLFGAGHRAASAGGAEAQLPLLLGLVVTALVAVVCAVRPPPAAPRRMNLVVLPFERTASVRGPDVHVDLCGTAMGVAEHLLGELPAPAGGSSKEGL